MGKCFMCKHVWQETTDDVASCNCCEDDEFFIPMKPWDIRPISYRDLPQLHLLYEQLTGEEGNIEALCDTFVDIETDDHYLLVGVFFRDTLIASATLTRCLDLTGDAKFYYNMENFVVKAGYWRQGFGAYLLMYLEQYVKHCGGSYINFTSSSERTGAHKFYAAQGYDPEYVKGFKKRF